MVRLAAEVQASAQWWHGSLVKIPSNRTVHGLCYLPKGYRLALVPPNTPLKFNIPKERASSTALIKDGGITWNETLSHSYSIPKIIISLLQFLYSITTLYRARGNQIEEYAAFGLTVTPYAFMSFVNIIGNLLTPTYSSMYLVANDRMEEARCDGGSFDGVVGCIDTQNMRSRSTDMSSEPWHLKLTWISWLVCLVPLAIVGGLSGFHSGHSTKAQRGWMMSWLVIGIVHGLVAGGIGYWTSKVEAKSSSITYGIVPAIGGFVVFSQMLKSYGSCIRIN